MTKKILIILFSILLTNCSEDNPDNTISEPNPNDDNLPEITISEFDDLIEKRTRFSVLISGTNEQTNTTVLINENEVVSTNQKDFEFEINPFDYPNGKTALTVRSVTSGTMESVKNEEFEIKKLLFRSFRGLSSESVNAYLAINLQSTGELVAFKKIITYDDPIFFHAEDNFIEEDIIVTEYALSNNGGFHVARMYGNVRPGTEIISPQKVADSLGLDYTRVNKESRFDITIEGPPGSGIFFSWGRGYDFYNSSAPTFEIEYDKELTDNIFLHYFTESNENIFDNYRYAYIENLEDQTLPFDEMSTVRPEDILTINNIPQTVKKVNLALAGFSNEDDYREGNWKLLLSYDIETALAGYSIDYPDFKEYPIINKNVRLDFINGNIISFVQRVEPDITIPDLTIQENDSIIKINGEHDFSELTLDIAHPDPESNALFRMIYKNRSLDSIEIPFDSIEIPEEVVQFLHERGLEVGEKNVSGEMELVINNYQNNVFPNGVFYYPLRNETGDSVRWTFPLQN
ncbi:MAG: hypothetical protein AAGC45_09225 [Bacteroidota bacterium]